MTGSSVAGPDRLSRRRWLVDGAIIYQCIIDKKRKFCVMTIEMLDVFRPQTLLYYLHLIG
jgi:hypothetical protein